MRSLRPSQVRARIVSEHVALRSQLDCLAVQALRVSSGELEHVQLLEPVEALYRDLREHLDFEDALLAPALREADAWGVIRAARLERHHREQRQALSELAERSRSEPPAALVQTVTSLIADLRADMTHEERDLLSCDLLRDDLVALDASGG
jgi:iron-sulfur cluster repair protein YtfE (RIC family)